MEETNLQTLTEVEQKVQEDLMKIQTGFSDPALADQLRFAQVLINSKALPPQIKDRYVAFAIIQAGKEMGMQPMESFQSLTMINSRIVIWGSALTKRLRMHGWKITWLTEDTKAEIECEVQIEKGDECYRYAISPKELEKIKSKPAYSADPKMKLRYHALSRLVRTQVAEVMNGIYAKEEIEDFEEILPEKKESKIIESVKNQLKEIQEKKDEN